MSTDTPSLDLPVTLKALTHCVVCALPLSDAASVELGVGPICREKGGYDLQAVIETLRPLANAAVRAIAQHPQGEAVLHPLTVLRSLGFEKLALLIEARIAPVRIRDQEDSPEPRYLVTLPDRALPALKRLPEYLPTEKKRTHSIPAAERASLTALLLAEFPGDLLSGRHGLVVCRPGSRVQPGLDQPTLLAMAQKLAASPKADCQAHAAQVGTFLDGSALPTPDWRPEVTTAEDHYAV